MSFRACIVAAVSTPDQATDDKTSIPSQRKACGEVCQGRGWKVVAEVLIPGHSRDYNWLDEIIGDCPEYGQLVRLIRSGQVDVVVCRDYDRLWRTDALRAQLTILCREHRVQVFSLNQPVEPEMVERLDANDAAQMMPIFYGFAAEQENRARVRQWRDGMRGRLAKGLSNCRAESPYGYRNVDPKKPLEVCPPEVRWVQYMYERRLAGRGYANIANELNDRHVPSRTGAKWWDISVKYILRNPIYKGEVRWREYSRKDGQGQRRLLQVHTMPGQQEPIVSAEIWERVQRINEAHTREYNRDKEPAHLLSGLVRCGVCGDAMVHMHSRTNHYYYVRCARYGRTGGRECVGNTLAVAKVHAFLFDALDVAAQDPDAILAARKSAEQTGEREKQTGAIEAEMRDIDSRLERLYAALETGAFDLNILAQRQGVLKVRREECERDLERLRNMLRNDHLLRENLMALAPLVGRWADVPRDELRAALVSVIRCVKVKKGCAPAVEWL